MTEKEQWRQQQCPERKQYPSARAAFRMLGNLRSREMAVAYECGDHWHTENADRTRAMFRPDGSRRSTPMPTALAPAAPPRFMQDKRVRLSRGPA